MSWQRAYHRSIALSLAVPLVPVRLIGFLLPFETKDELGSSTFHLYVPGLDFTLRTGMDTPEEISRGCLGLWKWGDDRTAQKL
jgi:hypothetical protein